MRKSLRNLLLGVVLAGSVQQAGAFSLFGPWETWMTANEGYQLPYDIGGPMNLGEEYRYNLPLLTYGFDESFLNYFGSKGVEEVEKAIKILNDLPAFSQMSAELKEYPLDTRRFNHKAGALYLYDLKSFTLGALLEQIGLAPAERYAWTLRSRVVIGNIPIYVVIKRNFDPVYPYAPTAYVNGVLYTYLTLQTWTTPAYEAVELDVDPSLPSVSSVSSSMICGGTVLAMGYFVDNEPGLFYTALTRDDVGGLRYIYRASNANVEVGSTNTTLAAAGSKVGNYLIGPGNSSPWTVPGVTNAVGTNLPPVDPVLRPGIDKLTFVRVDYNSMVGSWVLLTNRWIDYYITNSTIHSQLLERTITQPDILFAAGDIGVIGLTGIPYAFYRSMSWLNNDAINGIWTLAGPGNLRPPGVLVFSKLGQWLINIGDGGEPDAFPTWWWGSYDGTTNEPVVYPQGARIRDLERIIMSGRADRGPSPWQVPFMPVGQP
jgi:hypothetical protein